MAREQNTRSVRVEFDAKNSQKMCCNRQNVTRDSNKKHFSLETDRPSTFFVRRHTRTRARDARHESHPPVERCGRCTRRRHHRRHRRCRRRTDDDARRRRLYDEIHRLDWRRDADRRRDATRRSMGIRRRRMRRGTSGMPNESCGVATWRDDRKE